MNRAFMRSAADRLGLAAAPTFAAMALGTALWSGPLDGLCGAGAGFPGGGMSQMYLLMSAFHLSPWFKRAARFRCRSSSGDA